ncbi:serine/threonine-protein kinase D6PK-like [Zingiber officinale]|nr:serine/threonine-protein kinase D6PK-like [Zingiber officinale]
MPDDLVDDLQSMSFGSSDRSGVSSSLSSSSSSFSASLHKPRLARDPITDAIRRLGSSAGGGPGGNPLAMSDLRFVRRLGSGDIGNVYLAEIKCDGTEELLLAAKVMDKKELEGRSKEGRARTEREILEALDHPFLPRLYACAENDRYFCLLTEFCPGGDLHVLRQRQPGKRFDEAAVRFYASEVVVAMEYVHMMGIVYRDLKPENILVRSDGHIMLTDFDLSFKCDSAAAPAAQIVTDQMPVLPTSHTGIGGRGITEFSAASCIIPSCIVPAVSCFHPARRKRRKQQPGRRGPCLEFVAEPVDLRSMSFVGTHEYLAPEIVSGEGHGSAVDWWTLGVFVFEMLYGVTPFKGPDHELTLANIVARALEFPKEPTVSAAARDFITGLLVKDPERRLGSTMGAAAIKRHPFFNGVKWALLRCAVPPYVPPSFTLSTHSGDGSDDSCPGTPVDYY